MTPDLSGRDEDDETVALLSRPQTYGAAVTEVCKIETHAARVFLAGSKAYKIKKRVKLPFLDFTGLEQRSAALKREMELNQPHAPQIYIQVLPIVRAKDGRLQLGGEGQIVDVVLEMNRFEQSAVLERVSEKGPLPAHVCKALADMVSGYHRAAAVLHDRDGGAVMRETLAPLLGELRSAGDVVDPAAAGRVQERLQIELEKCSPLLTWRSQHGAIRRCHGDLHLGNIVMLDGAPVPFDALEFDERLATIDVLYDLAFLLMDLEFHSDRAAANAVANRYISAAPGGDEICGLRAFPLFLATRATVRAVVALERARQTEAAQRRTAADLARHYLELAAGYLCPEAPVLVAVGGLSGTGKSTLAASLSPLIGAAPGALHLRSDVERKHLFGLPEDQRLDPALYTPEVTQKVYHVLFDKARRALAAGHSAVIDAVSAKPREREAIEAIARDAGCRFAGLWLEAPADVMIGRVEARRGDASDADASVVRAQMHFDTGDMAWERIDASKSARHAHDAALSALVKIGICARAKRIHHQS